MCPSVVLSNGKIGKDCSNVRQSKLATVNVVEGTARDEIRQIFESVVVEHASVIREQCHG